MIVDFVAKYSYRSIQQLVWVSTSLDLTFVSTSLDLTFVSTSLDLTFVSTSLDLTFVLTSDKGKLDLTFGLKFHLLYYSNPTARIIAESPKRFFTLSKAWYKFTNSEVSSNKLI
jgi:hypothetical protein